MVPSTVMRALRLLNTETTRRPAGTRLGTVLVAEGAEVKGDPGKRGGFLKSALAEKPNKYVEANTHYKAALSGLVFLLGSS